MQILKFHKNAIVLLSSVMRVYSAKKIENANNEKIKKLFKNLSFQSANYFALILSSYRVFDVMTMFSASNHLI